MGLHTHSRNQIGLLSGIPWVLIMCSNLCVHHDWHRCLQPKGPQGDYYQKGGWGWLCFVWALYSGDALLQGPSLSTT